MEVYNVMHPLSQNPSTPDVTKLLSFEIWQVQNHFQMGNKIKVWNIMAPCTPTPAWQSSELLKFD